MNSLVDTHAHLDEFSDLETRLDRARAVGVVAVLAVGTGLESNRQVLRISRAHKGRVYPALGMHPWELGKKFEKGIRFVKENIDRCVAIGEIGLDYWIKKDQILQRRVFEEMLELAVQMDLTVSLHSRGAWKECYQIVKDKNVKKAVFHWYSGPIDVLKDVLERGYLISATPATEYSQHSRTAIAYAPLENILLETDSPVKYRGVEAEPATVIKSLNAVAKIKKVSQSQVARLTTENASRLFGLPL